MVGRRTADVEERDDGVDGGANIFVLSSFGSFHEEKLVHNMSYVDISYGIGEGCCDCEDGNDFAFGEGNWLVGVGEERAPFGEGVEAVDNVASTIQ